MGMELVHLLLILHPKKDEQAAGHSQAQAGDIDQGECLVLDQIPPGGLERVIKHEAILFEKHLKKHQLFNKLIIKYLRFF
jgi:hypothetical protein